MIGVDSTSYSIERIDHCDSDFIDTVFSAC